MRRKTASEVLAGNNPDEIHNWLWTANIEELRECLRRVKREDHWGSHARDALDILIAADSRKTAVWVFRLTVVAVICGLIQAFGVFWMIFHSH
jgi:hypothetical protein